jgi:hypothetical protein
MKTVHRLIVTLLVALALSGCSTNRFTTSSPGTTISIKNTKLYAYNFLDVRDSHLGPSMLAEVDKQLGQRLSASGVTLKVLQFKNSEVGKSFSSDSGAMTSPARETILSNLSAERAFQADYRLIIFPANMLHNGVRKTYTIRWDLMDVRSGKIVWTATSEGNRMVLWGTDELPVSRAKVIVDGLIEEMKANGLI